MRWLGPPCRIAGHLSSVLGDAGSWGMFFRLKNNWAKTKIQTTTVDSSPTLNHLQIAGNQMELVHGISYLSFYRPMMAEDSRFNVTSSLPGNAWTNYNEGPEVPTASWTSNYLFEATILPVLLYGEMNTPSSWRWCWMSFSRGIIQEYPRFWNMLQVYNSASSRCPLVLSKNLFLIAYALWHIFQTLT